MALSFPNISRSYDPRHRNVRFWGYDGTFEICFIVEQSAIARIAKGLQEGEAAALRVFDQSRKTILEAASRTYRGHATSTYSLVAADF